MLQTSKSRFGNALAALPGYTPANTAAGSTHYTAARRG